jgi:hypothetical protein
MRYPNHIAYIRMPLQKRKLSQNILPDIGAGLAPNCRKRHWYMYYSSTQVPVAVCTKFSTAVLQFSNCNLVLSS